MPEPESRRIEWMAAVAVPVAAAVAAATLAASQVAFANLLIAGQGWRLLALAWAAYLPAAVAWCLVIGGAILVIAAAGGRGRVRPWAAAAAAVAPLFVDGPVGRWMAPADSPTFAVVVRVVVAAAAILLTVIVARRVDLRPRLVVKAATVVVGVAVAAFAVTNQVVQCLRAAGEEAFTRAVSSVRISGRRVLLVGVDGASWHWLGPLIATGELPHLAALAEAGSVGPLVTLRPTESARIWPTIGSGYLPARHGVRDYLAWSVAGLSDPLIVRPAVPAGADAMLALAGRLGLAHALPAPASSCRAPRLWEIVAAAGARSAAIGWWTTWPADPASRSTVVTDVFAVQPDVPAAVSPPGLLPSLLPLRVAPADIGIDEVRRFVPLTEADYRRMLEPSVTAPSLVRHLLPTLARERTAAAITEHLLSAEPAFDLVAVYLRALDTMTHLAGGPDTPPASDEGISRRRGGLIEAAYRDVDRTIGRLLHAAGEGWTVVVVSDHGFDRRSDGSYGHDHAPPGIVVAAGDGIEVGARIRDAGVADVFPTVAALLGLAIADDAPGRPLDEILDDTIGSRKRIAGYGLSFSPPPSAVTEEHDRDTVDMLRALGYLD